MKRILLVLAFVLFASSVWAAGSCVVTSTSNLNRYDRVEVVLTCTGDGSISAYSFLPANFGVKGWFLYSITTDPGTAPTADYDITMVVNGEDVAGGLLADRSATATQTVTINPTTLSWFMAGNDPIAITFANETANPSVIVMTLRFIYN